MKKLFDLISWVRGLTGGQQGAYANKLIADAGGEEKFLEMAEAYLRGDVKVVFQDIVRKLIDASGRGIPISGMKGKVVDANRSFYIIQPKLDFGERLARLREFYPKDAKFVSAAEFEERCGVAIERVKGDKQVSNLLNGQCFPFVIPQLSGDLGQLLDDTIVPALSRSYSAQFPRRSFNNYRHNELAQQVTVIPGTRQDRLVEAMAKGPVCGVYFPALQGFGISADREFVGYLPDYLILSGLEVPVVATAYPEIIGRDFNTPGLDMASLQWQSAEYSLYCEARGGGFSFGRRSLGARACYAGGLSVLG